MQRALLFTLFLQIHWTILQLYPLVSSWKSIINQLGKILTQQRQNNGLPEKSPFAKGTIELERIEDSFKVEQITDKCKSHFFSTDH